MKVKFWGTRGAFAMSGEDFLQYGGNTTAVEVQNAAGQRVLIDLGTGATELAKELMAGAFGKGEGVLPVLLTHTHLDHIQGLPFFTPFFIKGNQIHILGFETPQLPLQSILQGQLNPHYSPLYGLENLAAGVHVQPVQPGSSLPVDGFEISGQLLPHGSMATMAYRISCDGATMCFMSDVEYPEGPLPEALALAKDADLLIHDGMFSDEEYETRRGWGHSSTSTAIEVARRSGAGRLALFHHSPDATDAVIDRVVEAAQAATDFPVFGAREGAVLDVKPSR